MSVQDKSCLAAPSVHGLGWYVKRLAIWVRIRQGALVDRQSAHAVSQLHTRTIKSRKPFTLY